jgi:acetoin utilization deacetylase AcuC-like enzyme
MATGWLWHELYMWHDTRHGASYMPADGRIIEPGLHAENPGTKRRFRNLLDVTGVLAQLVPVSPRPATDKEILRFHTADYLEKIKTLSADNGGDAGELTPFGIGSYEICALTAGGVISAIDAVLDGTVDNIYALVRPCGHHAEPALGRGFCVFGNAAIAVMHARQVRGIERAAVIDFDVHHGNGTQGAFYADPTVFTFSVHQDGYYPPGSGTLDEIGEGAGEGYNINVPLPAGSGDGAYVATFERVVAPALRAFKPDLIVVASGLDANAHDPLGRQQVTSDGYRQMTRILMDVADEVCEGRLVFEHEGGYSSAYVPFCGLAIVEELSGVASGIEDPFLGLVGALPDQVLQPHQDAVIAAAEVNVKRLM